MNINNNILREMILTLTFHYKKKVLLILTFIISGVMRFMVLYIPYKKIAAMAGIEGCEAPPDVVYHKHINIIRSIGQAVEKISRYTPWKSECFVQALTAQRLLKIFKISNTLYLGLAKDESNQLVAHAWLRSGQFIITGYRQMGRFKVIAKYTYVNNQY